MHGQGGADRLYGHGGDDSLFGGAGKDSLIGGAGADELSGDAGKDRFIYVAPDDSPGSGPDTILDLADKDRIDLSAIDANGHKAGDQAFHLVAGFTGDKGELVVHYHPAGQYAGFTTIQGDIDGDGAADFTILATGVHATFDNFAL